MKKFSNQVLFAKWLFEIDRENEMYPKTFKFEDVPLKERNLYLEEAKHYLMEHPLDNWPDEILKRMVFSK